MISKYNKKVCIALSVILTLHLIAVICSYINQEPIFGTPLSFRLSITRSSIYIGLFIAWGFYIRHRIVMKQIRTCLLGICFCIVFWVSIRSIRYAFAFDFNVKRYLWYLYYIPMLCIPVLALAVGMRLGKIEEKRISFRVIFLLISVTLALITLVLTNDFHQLVFIFPKDSIVFSDVNYTYGIGYYVVLGWIALCVITSFFIILSKCRIPNIHRISWLPMIPLLCSLAYSICYINHVSFIIRFMPDMTLTLCILIVCMFEGCIISGLIQSNTHYEELFLASNLPVCITDKNYEQALPNPHFSQEMMTKDLLEKSREESSVLLEDNIRLSSADLRKNYVFWLEDVSEMTEILEELQEVKKSLEERHTLVKEEYRIRKEKARLEEIQRLYYKMQQRTKGKLERMQKLAEMLEETEDTEKQKCFLQP